MSDSRASYRLFVILLPAYLAYAAWFIYRTSFIADGQRYFCLFDDAMISMTYARNLAEGHGLVWFPGGERVEGFTNPLWTLWMALLHFLPVSAAKISLLVQTTSAALLAANLYFVKRVADLLSGGRWVWIPAVILTAFYLPLNNWALQGMEVGLLALMITAAAWLALRTLAEKRFFPGLYVLLAAALLTRMDAAVPFLVLWGYLLVSDPHHRKRHLRWGLGVFLGVNLGLTLFRWAYYGDLLPNTYSLKMTGSPLGLRLARGWMAFLGMIRQTWAILFALPLATLLFRRDRLVWLIPNLFAAQAAYSVWVGGDAWEDWGLTNRYITVVMPLFLVLLCLALATLEARLRNKLVSSRVSGGVLRFNLIIVLALATVELNFIHSPNPTLREWLGDRPLLAVKENREMVEIALLMKEITRPDARLGVTWAGIIPYFSQRPAVDFLGKNDRHIARLPAHPPAGPDLIRDFRPGHTKWDYNYSIRKLQPDVVLQFFGVPWEEANSYVIPEYCKEVIRDDEILLLMSSKKVDWYAVYKRLDRRQNFR